MVEEIRKVGGEVDAHCTKCKMVLAHTILAMVGPKIARVRCNTCMGEHAFKAAAPEPKAKAPRATKAKASKSKKITAPGRGDTDTFENLMRGKDASSAVAYSVRGLFATGQVISHPTFGTGVVAASRGVGKIDVVFESGVKTLMHNKDAIPTEMARALPRRSTNGEAAEESGSTDAAALGGGEA